MGQTPERVLVDTCVIIDIFDSTSSRHMYGRELGSFFVQKGIFIRTPFTTLFEMQSVITRKAKKEGHELMKTFNKIGEGKPLQIEGIPVDQPFLDSYFDGNLPYLKGIDLIMLSIAAKEPFPFITEDDSLYKRAKEIRPDVFRIREFLEEYDQAV